MQSETCQTTFYLMVLSGTRFWRRAANAEDGCWSTSMDWLTAMDLHLELRYKIQLFQTQ